ncbi:GNAT family N-acetyltransferase [Candidatus Bathyarchaeota archaeon]|nr:MAG: GNAT family N-acetyltransferase [Candidatus Bathyarchaeota archaeon]
MTPSFAIRKYQGGDREHCRALWRELTKWHREIYQDPTIGGEHPEDYFDKHLATVGPNQLWVAVHDSKAIGLIGLVFKGEEAEIEPLIVSKAYRRKGIGTKLIDTAISEAQKMGAKYLNIAPVARNISTLKFLYKRGFKKLGYITLFIDFANRTWKTGPEIFECKFKY